MTILAIDTTTDHGSIAVCEEGQLIRECGMSSSDGYSSLLFRYLQSLVEEKTVHFVNDVVFAAASGPGSFTGVRVGLATVKALAEATGNGALGISNLQALAALGSEPRRAVLIAARRGECYAAVYDAGLQLVEPETVASPVEWIASLPAADYQFITQDASWLEALVRPTRFASCQALEAPRLLAPAIARCAALQIAAGIQPDPVALDANYVRRSDVNLFWHDR